MSPTWRRTLIAGGFAIGVAIVALVAIIAYVLLNADEETQPTTQRHRYAPSPAVDVLPPSEENTCWTGSIATSRYDAYRCSTENGIIDPCFTYGADTLVCPVDPRTTADDFAFTFDVSTVPAYGVRGEANVWFMVVGGQGCYAITGAAPSIAGKSFPFGCSEKLFCTPPVEGPEGFVSDCWRSDSGLEDTYTVDAVWY